MHKLTFKLKQHTPIIHFQHDQHGATLRASEVKPKLDRFIIEQNDGFDKVKKKHPYWLVGSGEHPALNYKMFISPNNTPKQEIEKFHKNAPMYFGNMGDENPPKHFKFIDNTEVVIRSYNNTLLSDIKIHLCPFFFQNNFGTRQSKGYGSFEVININSNSVNYSPSGYNFSFNLKTGDWKCALYQIGLFYKALRSGINEVNKIFYDDPNDSDKAIKCQKTVSKFYFKPLIFLYARHLNKQWDKKTIKEVYFNRDYVYRNLTKKEKEKNNLDYKSKYQMEELGLKKQKTKHNYCNILEYSENNIDNHFFLDFKDVFGLSSSEEWKSYGKSIVKTNATNNSTPKKFISKTGDVVERFKSPLFFKPIRIDKTFNIYVSYQELPKEYKGQKFIVFNNKKMNYGKLCLKVPSDFLFDHFFKFIFDHKNFNIDKHVDSKYKKAIDKNNFELNYFQVLKEIFNQLQKIR